MNIQKKIAIFSQLRVHQEKHLLIFINMEVAENGKLSASNAETKE